MTDHPHTLLTAALDAGDRLVAAVAAGDLEAATTTLAARAEAIARLEAAPRPATLPQALVIRFRAQDARLSRLLTRQLAAAADDLAGAARVGTAHAGYGTSPAPARLDTAPR